MSKLSAKCKAAIKEGLEKHRPGQGAKYSYGTAGFRMNGDILKPVLFRVGILAALRSKKRDGKTIGVMVTASHNPPVDNGVKIVDPDGEMLEASWEVHATKFANVSTEAFIDELEKFITAESIDLGTPANVVYARDTRQSGPGLVAALNEGLQALNANIRPEDEATTPILHYLVRAVNGSYGPPNKDGYYSKLSDALKKLLPKQTPPPKLLIDCANGVGTLAAQEFRKRVAETLALELEYTKTETDVDLNLGCGADHVKTKQAPPLGLTSRPGLRACSLDGDADRLIYYYWDESGNFHMLDGDKIATLAASFLVKLVRDAGLDNQIKAGVVQTAYANGESTNYIKNTLKLPVTFTATGVKHLHHAAASYDIGVYFEANGHGTVLFSDSAQKKIQSHQTSNDKQQTALTHLKNVIDLINQTVGDALSDMFLVEVALSHLSYETKDWAALYTDLPNRLAKVEVKNRNDFTTKNAETCLVTPQGAQDEIDALVKQYTKGRSFVRPSGTENVVRVYAEAEGKGQADDLAHKVASLVYDRGGGDPSKKPTKFW
ncbi:hypothetical protein HYDPIDRAFT_24771 [Hydnomerulius pinastri MD-312]|nr:hypothetical protein HYDPIDRAFT_24771 [Hydnomerulius pinastri MD-312]